jgi:hypothetical protein
MQTTSNTASPIRKIVFGLLAGGAVILCACSVTVSNTCGGTLTDCGGYCADLNSSDLDCGACGASCLAGDYCHQGVCIVGSCLTDNSACTFDSDCCSDYCASDGLCGCIPTGNAGCASDTDCCSNNCAPDGVCDP